MSTSLPDAVVGACDAVDAALADLPATDLDARTPCADFALRALVEHFVGTSGAMARLGVGEPLDPEDPWGGGDHATEGDWVGRLRENLARIAEGWGRPEAWEGEAQVGGNAMPRPMLGQMALIEVATHGWDVARSAGRDVRLDPGVADALDDAAAQTAELGRRMGAYGPEVHVGPDADGLARALGRTGRDPAWRG
ncbi:TIGR03086 family metal-binding protein [Microlunatus flavus]|uniref:TIGR03086 family protein n=1 Tax=Microlunatus flavus TaxID=1036181 RepID=A0A1H9JCV6_9ACTN|nr:TIGR03086 family metal-binding protein [Microlunatus flavus]SEQ84666.1 TIGR03086 family protein [Microlunatus flavus]